MMLEILRDPVWQFVGALLALVAIGISVWVFLAQRPRKRLLIETVARVPLVTFGSKGIPNLRILFNDNPVENASVLLVRIENIGNVPILASDYEQQVTLQFEEGARVLNADIGETKPKHLPIDVEFSERSALIARSLLNPGDTLNCRVLVENSKGEYTAKARIVGVGELETVRKPSFALPLMAIASLAVIVSLVILMLKQVSGSSLEAQTEAIPYMLVFALGMLVLIATLLIETRSVFRWLRERIVLISGDLDA